MATWFGTNFPFFKGKTLFGSTPRVLDRQEDSRIIKNDYLQGLLTNKTERVFRPGFGGNIGTFIFEQNDVSSREDLENSIRQQTNTYHPRIKLSKISVQESKSNPNVIEILVFGRTDLEAINVDGVLAKFMVPISGTIGNNAESTR